MPAVIPSGACSVPIQHIPLGMLIPMTTSSDNTMSGVVVHLDEAEPDKHASVLRNIGNLLDALDDGTQIELVVHGPGLAAVVINAPHAARLRELLSRGVAVAACANTMREKNISTEGLVEGVHVVPAGIAELVRRQREGWAYVRP